MNKLNKILIVIIIILIVIIGILVYELMRIKENEKKASKSLIETSQELHEAKTKIQELENKTN